jgi:hypothetical protein
MLGLLCLALVALALPPRSFDQAARPRTSAARAVNLASARLSTATVRIETGHPGDAFSRGAVGLSIEAYELQTRDLNATHSSLVALMRGLGPGVLRIGGSSVDRSWWTVSPSARRPTWATSVVTPDALARLSRLLVATGWRVILGIDLGHFEPTNAASEVDVAHRLLGRRLLGIELGNEPDKYGTRLVDLRSNAYGVTSYLADLLAYRSAIGQMTPGLPVFGPDVPSLSWLQAVSAARPSLFSGVTLHYYPTTYSYSGPVCRATALPTAKELLSPATRESESAVAQHLVRFASSVGGRPWISETNTTSSCDADGGPLTSPVFASALWALDWSLRAASAGVSALNFHGYFGVCGPASEAPICSASHIDEGLGVVQARPEYFGLLAASSLEGGRFIPAEVTQSAVRGGVIAFATLAGVRRITVAVENLSGHSTLTAIDPVSGYALTSVRRLTAPSLDAVTDVRFRRVASVDQQHQQVGRRRPPTPTFVLPPFSALIVALRRPH